jgi:hypothetical protein
MFTIAYAIEKSDGAQLKHRSNFTFLYLYSIRCNTQHLTFLNLEDKGTVDVIVKIELTDQQNSKILDILGM